MTRNYVVQTARVLLLLGMFVACGSPAMAAPTCSLDSVAGHGGFTISGSFLLPTGGVPVVAVGTYMIGADGSFSGTATRSVGGVLNEETIAGSLAMNANCSGTVTAQVFQSGQLTHTVDFAVVFDDNGNEIRGMITSLVLSNGTSIPSVVTVEGRRLTNSSDD